MNVTYFAHPGHEHTASGEDHTAFFVGVSVGIVLLVIIVARILSKTSRVTPTEKE